MCALAHNYITSRKHKQAHTHAHAHTHARTHTYTHTYFAAPPSQR